MPGCRPAPWVRRSSTPWSRPRALYAADDTAEARSRLSALHDALTTVEQVAGAVPRRDGRSAPRRPAPAVRSLREGVRRLPERHGRAGPDGLAQGRPDPGHRRRDGAEPRTHGRRDRCPGSRGPGPPERAACRRRRGPPAGTDHADRRAGRGAHPGPDRRDLDHLHPGPAAAGSFEGQHDGPRRQRPRTDDPVHASPRRDRRDGRRHRGLPGGADREAGPRRRRLRPAGAATASGPRCWPQRPAPSRARRTAPSPISPARPRRCSLRPTRSRAMPAPWRPRPPSWRGHPTRPPGSSTASPARPRSSRRRPGRSRRGSVTPARSHPPP